MGKVRINTIGDENLEKQQKVKAEKRKTTKKTPSAGASASPEFEQRQSKAMADKKKQNIKGEQQGEKKERKETKEIPAAKNVEKTSSASVVKKVTNAGSKRSEKYQAIAKLVDITKIYPLSEALELLPKLHLSKFDETVELHINTHQTGISGNTTLPHGTGKQIKVAILAPNTDQKAADALLKQIESGTLLFDVLIATPDAMPKLAKVARVLGPRGLMPNPKNGTITTKPDEAAKQFAGGQINFKTESKTPVIHLSVGKLSFKK